jgi:uncharacterized protein YggE
MKFTRLLALLIPLIVPSALAQNAAQLPQINISGSAEIKMTPDQVNIRVAVENRNESLDQARTQHDEHMRSALQFLKTMHVPNKDVQTDYISVAPEYNNDSWRGKGVVYIVRKSIEINLTNIALFEPVLTGLLTNGVTHIQNVQFRTSNLRKYRDEARAKAIQAAKEKADALCAALGVKRGKPLTINANEFSGSWTYGGNFNGSWGSPGDNYAGNAQVVAQNSEGSDDSVGTTVSLGQISVSATVNVSFALE